MTILYTWLVLSFAVWLTATVLPGVHVKGFGNAVIVAAMFGVINYLVGWVFFVGLGIATLGLAWVFAFLTRWLVNAIVLKITDVMTDRLKIDSFGWAMAASFMMSAIGTLAQFMIR